MAKGILSDDREKFVFGTNQIARFITNLVKKSPKKTTDSPKISNTQLDKIQKQIDEGADLTGVSSEEVAELAGQISQNANALKARGFTDKRIEELLEEAYTLGESKDLELALKQPIRTKKQDGGKLQNPEKADLDNDGELSSYEETRGKAIEENMRDKKFVGGGLKEVVNQIRTNHELRKKIGMPDIIEEEDEYGELKPLPPIRISAQVGGMMMDDQMADMMETEETPDMDNQMADMMPEEKTEEQKAIEKAQAPDEMMEENYVDFLIDEALSDDEEAMLMQELQANPQLSMLFDKVMEVAMEFSGSGPVEGPGTEVSDSIPARLSDGEFVFTAKSVDVLGADNLMSLMKQAEAQADQRQTAQDGGMMEEEDTAMPVQQEPVRQDIRVTKETVDSQAAMQDEEDLVGDEIKKSMLSGRPHVRS